MHPMTMIGPMLSTENGFPVITMYLLRTTTYDRNAKTTSPDGHPAPVHADFCPAGNRVAYVIDNDL